MSLKKKLFGDIYIFIFCNVRPRRVIKKVVQKSSAKEMSKICDNISSQSFPLKKKKVQCSVNFLSRPFKWAATALLWKMWRTCSKETFRSSEHQNVEKSIGSIPSLALQCRKCRKKHWQQHPSLALFVENVEKNSRRPKYCCLQK